MVKVSKPIGFYPRGLDLAVGAISVRSLPNLTTISTDLLKSEGVHQNWIYAPAQEVYMLGGGIEKRPYPSRVFGLPKTHLIEHASATDEEHVDFLIWVLSFLTGMRLTATEAGFVDATPLQPGALVDFSPGSKGLGKGLALAEAFWAGHGRDRAALVAAAVHALFIAQNPLALEYERFAHLYMALDACFRLAQQLHPPGRKLNHEQRIEWMCGLFNMAVPTWAVGPASGGKAPVVDLRNNLFHEALYEAQPVGFAIHVLTDNLILEMQALVCRFLVALLGAPNASYVTASISSRQMDSLDL